MEISVTLIIVIITSLVSINAFSNQRTMNDLIFYPPSIGRGQWYRFFSCGLINADAGHLIFNMLALYLFGAGQHKTGVEYEFIELFGERGRWFYLLMYVAALGLSLLPTYLRNRDNYHYRSLGASGAVSAVVFASIVLSPLDKMGLFIIPIYIAGFLFGAIYLLLSSWLDRTGRGGNINHSAHIFGALFGIAFTIVMSKALSEQDVVKQFIWQMKHVEVKDLIQFGRSSY
jgi:membrane associated rhomboid family serine protease